jgi:hypothetical protein
LAELSGLRFASAGVHDARLELVKTLVGALVAIVLILAMTWIVVSPTTDETQKGALVVIGSAVGFIFGRETK